MSILDGQLWKVATAAAGVVSLVLIALLLAANVENRNLMKQRTELSKQINDPETGFVARLTQARTNEAQLRVAIERQRQTFQAAAEQNNARLVETERQLAAAQVQTRQMETRLRSFLSTAPQGSTAEEQISDIDSRGLEEMVQ